MPLQNQVLERIRSEIKLSYKSSKRMTNLWIGSCKESRMVKRVSTTIFNPTKISTPMMSLSPLNPFSNFMGIKRQKHLPKQRNPVDIQIWKKWGVVNSMVFNPLKAIQQRVSWDNQRLIEHINGQIEVHRLSVEAEVIKSCIWARKHNCKEWVQKER